MSSRHKTILDAVATKIQSLNLSGISSSNVRVSLLAVADRLIKAGTITLPAIIVSPTLAETINQGLTGDNKSDVYGYPCTIAIVENATASSLTTDLDKYMTWRETLIKAFHYQRLSGDSQVLRCDVTPTNIVELNAWVENSLFVSGFNVRFLSKELVR